MSDWGITQRVPAQAVLAEGDVLDGDLHLMVRTSYPPGPESPLEMLNRAEEFFTLALANGGVVFLSKARVSLIACRDQVPPPDPDRLSAAKTVDLEVILADGTEVRGCATLELPPTRARALDYVNSPGRFLALRSDGVTRYVNKSLVRLIRPLD